MGCFFLSFWFFRVCNLSECADRDLDEEVEDAESTEEAPRLLLRLRVLEDLDLLGDEAMADFVVPTDPFALRSKSGSSIGAGSLVSDVSEYAMELNEVQLSSSGVLIRC